MPGASLETRSRERILLSVLANVIGLQLAISLVGRPFLCNRTTTDCRNDFGIAFSSSSCLNCLECCRRFDLTLFLPILYLCQEGAILFQGSWDNHKICPFLGSWDDHKICP